jgi:hypothetical protein
MFQVDRDPRSAETQAEAWRNYARTMEQGLPYEYRGPGVERWKTEVQAVIAAFDEVARQRRRAPSRRPLQAITAALNAQLNPPNINAAIADDMAARLNAWTAAHPE